MPVSEHDFYKESLERAESGPLSVGYALPISQKVRHDLVTKRLLKDEAPESFSLLDVGCGTGDLLRSMLDANRPPKKYLGIDRLSEMTERADRLMRAEHPPPEGSQWGFHTGEVHHLLVDKVFGRVVEHDYVVSIAMLALKDPNDDMAVCLAQVRDTIWEMAQLARKAVLITLFSTWKTDIQPEEFIVDPAAIFTWAKSLWPRVELIHSYAPHDFALLIDKRPGEWWLEWEKAGHPSFGVSP